MLADGDMTYDSLQLGSSPPFICPSETDTDVPVESALLGSGMYDYQLQFMPASSGTAGSMGIDRLRSGRAADPGLAGAARGLLSPARVCCGVGERNGIHD